METDRHDVIDEIIETIELEVRAVQVDTNTDRLLQSKDIAKALNVSRGAVLNWIRAGVIPSIPLPNGRGYRIRQEVLDKLLQEQERKT